MPGPAELALDRWPAEDSLTHDVDTSLEAVLETDALNGACAAWRSGARDRQTMLRCGKWMFFYETFGTIGIPDALLELAQRYFADSYFGVGFSRFGFIPDPHDQRGMPLGLAPTTGTLGGVKTRAFTCASCHFGRMPDGRYAVGYGNLALDYGRFIVAISAPLPLSLSANAPTVPAAMRAELAGPVAHAKEDPGYMLEVAGIGLMLLPLASSATMPSVEEQELFLTLRTGTMDFLTKPILDDGVWTVSRIPPLWNLPDETMRAQAGMGHEMLSWTGGTKSMMDFLEGFILLGRADAQAWTADALLPLAEYVRSLRTPPLLVSLDASKVERGRALFVDKGCRSCHSGPSGESRRAFTFEEIGTDSALRDVFAPRDGKPCCGLEVAGEFDPTYGVKAGRLVGIENQLGFLHNGSVGSLEELFCLRPRPAAKGVGQGSGGHRMTCDGLLDTDKLALIEYLKSL